MISAHDAILSFLKIRPHWRVSTIDAQGLSGGLLTAWNPDFGELKAYHTIAGLLVEGHIKGFTEPIRILNIYGPCRDRLPFWEKVDSHNILHLDNLIVGGDLNLTLGQSELWGGKSLEDSLSGYFKQLFIRTNLVDISLANLAPTWRNGRTGDENIAKRLDRFLVSGNLIDRVGRYRSWTSPEGISDHLPVSLQVDFHFNRVQYPFKFNKVWLSDCEFKLAVENYWNDLGYVKEGSDRDTFLHKLSLVKRFVVNWMKKKKVEQTLELLNVESELADLLKEAHHTTFKSANKERLLILNNKKYHLLLIQEITWRLKSRALWIDAGD